MINLSDRNGKPLTTGDLVTVLAEITQLDFAANTATLRTIYESGKGAKGVIENLDTAVMDKVEG